MRTEYVRSELEMRAMFFAEAGHGAIDHRRRYSKQPYIVHPSAVVEIVRSVSYHTQEMLAAAWMHDLVEDTAITLDTIRRLFGYEVARLVEELTDVAKPEDGNRAERREIDRKHSAKASPEGQTIKEADIIDNTKDIMLNDANFAKIYIPEIQELLRVLHLGDRTLWEIAAKQVGLTA